MLATVTAGVFGTLAVCGMAYYILCIWSARCYLRPRKLPTLSLREKGAAPQQAEIRHFAPPVSILKPVRGTDRGMYESLRSHCTQDYPAYEIIFGVQDAADPAVEVIRRLQREFPSLRIELVLCPQSLGANAKVSNLVQMMPRARHDYLLVSDSDVRIEPQCLRALMSHFADPNVGLATALYRARAGDTLGSKLEAIGISTDFAAGVLAANHLEGGIRFALGATMALSRRALHAIGGFQPLLDYLADDFQLGNRISARGFAVALADTVPETYLPDYGFGAFWAHQLRWARAIRDSRKLGYLGLGVSFGLPWAILAMLAAKAAPWSLALLLVTALLRLAMARVVAANVLGDAHVMRRWWLVPLRDIIALAVWVWSYAGRTVEWRGDRFILSDGKLTQAGTTRP